jgi:hypothetical protein
MILPVRGQRRGIIQYHRGGLYASIQWMMIIRPLILLLRLLIVFGELFKEQKHLEKLDKSRKLLLL